MAAQQHSFYVGVRSCGCVTARLTDDAQTTAKDVADFARAMQRSHRRVEHRTVTRREFEAMFEPCADCARKNLPRGANSLDH